MEHGLVRVQGEIAGHEADLDDRPQPERQDPVVDAVDATEVVDRLTVDLTVDTEVVVEDRVSPHGAYAELVVGHLQGGGELLADVPAAGADAVVELGEALRPDHRPPRAVERSAHFGGIDVHPAGRVAVSLGRRLDRLACGLPVIVDRGHRGDRVPRGLAGTTRRVRQRRMRDRPHPRLTDHERGVRAIGRGRAADEIAGGALHRFPVERDLTSARVGDETCWCRQRRQTALSEAGAPASGQRFERGPGGPFLVHVSRCGPLRTPPSP